MNPLRAFGLSLLLTCVSSAATVNWTGPSDFDDERITFAGFTANRLLSINPADGYGHTHGDDTIGFGLEVELNGSWMNVASFLNWSQEDFDISNFAPATFSTGTITGLRVMTTSYVGNAFHGFSEATTFTFDTGAGAVPEPSTFALLALGGTAVTIVRRRKLTR